MITVLTTIVIVIIILVAAYLLLGTYLFLTVVPFAAILSAAIAIMNIFKAISIENEFSKNTTQLHFKDNEIKRTYGKGISWTSITTVLTLIVSFGLNEKRGLSALWSFIPFAAFCLTCVMLNLYNKRMSSKLEQAKTEDEAKASSEQTYGEYLQEKEKQKQEAKEEKQRQKQEKQERKAAAEAEEKRQKQETREKTVKAVGNAVTAVGNTATKAASSVVNSRVVKSVQDSVVESIEDRRDEKHLKSQIKQANMIIDGQQQVKQKAIESNGQLALVDSTATDDEFRNKAANLGVKVEDKSVEEIAQQVLALSSQAAIDALPAGLDDVTKAKYILDGRV